VRRLAVVALLFTACAPATTMETPVPSTTELAASPTPPPTASSAFPTATFSVDQSATWPVVLYEGDGGIVRRRTESASTTFARSCARPVRLEARPAGLLEWCRSAAQDSDELRLVSLPDGRVTVLAAGTLPSWPADVSPDGRSVAAFRRGECLSPAPVCQARPVLIDVATGRERDLLPNGYPLGATLEWTTLGLTFFQPECADAGCAGIGDKGGTFVWDGSALKRWSDLRFVASAGSWTLLERLRSLTDPSDQRAVVIRGPQGERTLSAGHALAISGSGETLVWVPGPDLLMRFAPDGRALWQASLVGAVVLKMIGPDAMLVATPTNRIEIYDLDRMLRFAPTEPISYVVAGVVR
jgi:hypothetical protein